MAKRRRHPPLKVCLNGRLVGWLRQQSSGAIDFRYDPLWLEWEHALPVSFSLPLREDPYTGAAVIAVFDNLLPDNEKIRRRMAERLGAEGADAYSLLAAAGRDCVGALQFLPEDAALGPVGGTHGTPVDNEEIGSILDRLADTPLGLQEGDDFRISIAGAQDKTALLKLNGHWLKPHGMTATTHILKPPIGRARERLDLSDSVENEWISLELVRAMGIPTTKAEIADFAGRKALVVERFDRLWTTEKEPRLLRLPQEDCCQALGYPPTKKYESDGGPGIAKVMDLLNGSDEPALDRRAYFKAQVVFWLLAAIDGHAKNFSVALAEGGRFRMTPLYDVMSAEPYLAAGRMTRQKIKLAVAVGDKRHYEIDEIVPRHFLQSGTKVGLPGTELDSIFADIVALAPKAIDKVAAAMPSTVLSRTFEPIAAGIRRRLKLFG